MTAAAVPPPRLPTDDKPWVVVLERPCAECGYDTAAYRRGQLVPRLQQCAAGWHARLAASEPGFDRRPDATTWSPIEYAAHVGDVFALLLQRVGRMLDEDGPQFTNWDQDAAAFNGRYYARTPAEASTAIAANAAAAAARLDALPPEAWTRTGTRSDGTPFSVESLTRYMLHDVVHHLVDVGGARDTDPTAR
jgi:hypothetical protein